MIHSLRKFPIIVVIGIIAILIIPLYAKAEVQTQVTEIADFKPYENNNDEVANIANDTITYNTDTWNPLPSGVFVGGTIKESKMELREYAVGISQGATFTSHYSELLLTTPMQVKQDYVMTGASQFVVRLPLAMDEFPPSYIVFYIYKMPTPDDYQIVRRVGSIGSGGGNVLDVLTTDGGTLDCVAYGTLLSPFPDSPTAWAYVRDGRAYCSITAPLHSDVWYLLVCHAYYPVDSRFQFYFTAGDLCSDGITSSHVAYEYHPAFDQNITKDNPVNADLGFSFVFQAGLGLNAISYSRLFNAGDELRFNVLIPIGTATYHVSCLNFLTEFRTNNETITWGVEASAVVDGLSQTVLSHTYWTGKTHNSMIVASQPTMYNYTSNFASGGINYIKVLVILTLESTNRIEFLLVDDDATAIYSDVPYTGNPYQRLWHFNGIGEDLEMLFFNLWSTVSLDQLSLNWSVGASAPSHSLGFWEGVGHWWDKHWIDGLALVFIVGGIALSPFTLGGSLALVSIGITILLYHNWAAFRNAVNNLIKYVLDGLEWLGKWLWKIGMMIWKALTWFIDRLVYFGSELIAMLIYFGAVILPVFIILITMKLMSILYRLAKADLKGAEEESRDLIHTVSGGKVG